MHDKPSTLRENLTTEMGIGCPYHLASKTEASEAQIVATEVGNKAIRLDVDWIDTLPKLEQLGDVRIITRNETIVHKKVGTFGKCSITQSSGLVLNGDVDLRIFFDQWHHTFLLQTPYGPSIQVFDQHGAAVHKIYSTEATNHVSWNNFITQHTADNQSPDIEILPPPPAPMTRKDEDVDVEALRAHWSHLKDVHHFHGMLGSFGISRIQAMRLVAPPWATPASDNVLQKFLGYVKEKAMPFMVFVGNRGCIQIHTGTIDSFETQEDWTNIFGPHFSMHTLTSEISSAWIVKKPSRESAITTLELFDARGENCAIFSGQRDPGTQERHEWRELLAELAIQPEN